MGADRAGLTLRIDFPPGLLLLARLRPSPGPLMLSGPEPFCGFCGGSQVSQRFLPHTSAIVTHPPASFSPAHFVSFWPFGRDLVTVHTFSWKSRRVPAGVLLASSAAAAGGDPRANSCHRRPDSRGFSQTCCCQSASPLLFLLSHDPCFRTTQPPPAGGIVLGQDRPIPAGPAKGTLIKLDALLTASSARAWDLTSAASTIPLRASPTWLIFLQPFPGTVSHLTTARASSLRSLPLPGCSPRAARAAANRGITSPAGCTPSAFRTRWKRARLPGPCPASASTHTKLAPILELSPAAFPSGVCTASSFHTLRGDFNGRSLAGFFIPVCHSPI